MGKHNEFVKDNDEVNHEVFKSDNENDLGIHDNKEEEIAFLDGLLEDENFFMNDKKVEFLERKTKEDFETKVEPKSKQELQVFHPDIEILDHFETTSYVGDAFKDKSSKELASSKALLTLDVFDPLHPPLMDFHVFGFWKTHVPKKDKKDKKKQKQSKTDKERKRQEQRVSGKAKSQSGAV
ncbi:hypothetical protein Tco_1394379 [Tanacetum coccineum]